MAGLISGQGFLQGTLGMRMRVSFSHLFTHSRPRENCLLAGNCPKDRFSLGLGVKGVENEKECGKLSRLKPLPSYTLSLSFSSQLTPHHPGPVL